MMFILEVYPRGCAKILKDIGEKDIGWKEIMSPKASFDEQYKLYSPKSSVQFFLRDLSYRLPFSAMTLLGNYLKLAETSPVLETAIVGSCHGLDSAVLKYGYTYDDTLKYWLDGEPETHIFHDGNPMSEITMIGIINEDL